MKNIILLASAFLLFSQLTHAQDGELNQSFGTGGIVKTNFADTTWYNSTDIQSDGKIVVAGYTWNGRNYDFLLARYNTDGSLDHTFSDDGKHKTGFGSVNSYANAVAVQKDGKIVAAGSSNSRIALARYNTDGSLDNTFSGNGKQISSFSGSARSLALQGDGKIVVAGVVNGASAVVRYTADGSLDNSFSSDGIQTTAYHYATAIAIQSDGKIVAVGEAGDQFAVARFNTDGSLDKTFSDDGMETIEAGEVNSSANSVAIQKDGKIVVSGYIAGEETNAGYAIYRLNTDGSFDNTFHERKDYGFNFINSIAIQSDGKIVGGGSAQGRDDIKGNFAVFRFHSTGRPDSSFNGDGIQITEIEGVGFYGIQNITVADNKLYAIGNTRVSGFVGTVAAYLLDNPNNAPTVSISIPNNISYYTAPARIKINAIAHDANGTVKKVQFFSGNTLLHTEDKLPYGFFWIDVPAGEYALTAKAFDNDGFSTTSNTIHVSVATLPPVVRLVSPVNNSAYTAPATIPLAAQATDPDGKVSRVEFYQYSYTTRNETLIRTEYYYPYRYSLSNVPSGKYSFTAVAYDDKGVGKSSHSVIITVNEATLSSRSTSINSQPDLKDAISLKLSPNPVQRILNIYTNEFQSNKPLTLAVVSAAGVVQKTMQSNTSNKAVQMDVSSLVSGVYTVKVICGDKVMFKQFVKL